MNHDWLSARQPNSASMLVEEDAPAMGASYMEDAEAASRSNGGAP
jgi:hypothetical protein